MASYNVTSASFLGYCRDERRLSPHTVRAYCLDLACFGEFLMAHAPSLGLGEISRDHLRAYRPTLGHLRPCSVGRRMAALRSLFYFAENEKLIAVNPFEGFWLQLRIGRTRPRVLGQKTVERFSRARSTPDRP